MKNETKKNERKWILYITIPLTIIVLLICITWMYSMSHPFVIRMEMDNNTLEAVKIMGMGEDFNVFDKELSNEEINTLYNQPPVIVEISGGVVSPIDNTTNYYNLSMNPNVGWDYTMITNKSLLPANTTLCPGKIVKEVRCDCCPENSTRCCMAYCFKCVEVSNE